MTQRSVLLILLAALLLLVGWDIYLATDGIDGNTISAALLAWASSVPFLRPVLALAVGVLIGHLFWPQSPES